MKFIDIKDELKDAIIKDKPVVALESTIISHGMPYPDNLETALSLEDIIRKEGAIPATIAIINGRIKIGLNREELEYLARAENIIKVSRRDLAIIIAKNGSGATTVAATMYCASLAGIKVFATGGIGGVHRGAEKSFDISADLEEFKRTKVAVVSAGVKSILDIGATLEKLETYGVPILTYQTDIFPDFYTRLSPFKVDYMVNTPEEAADIINVKWELGLDGGVLIANPVPEESEIEPGLIKTAIENALKEAKTKDISGKRITPFLLKKIVNLTDGKSLNTNISLVKNNAYLAARIAKHVKKEG